MLLLCLRAPRLTKTPPSLSSIQCLGAFCKPHKTLDQQQLKRQQNNIYRRDRPCQCRHFASCSGSRLTKRLRCFLGPRTMLPAARGGQQRLTGREGLPIHAAARLSACRLRCPDDPNDAVARAAVAAWPGPITQRKASAAVCHSRLPSARPILDGLRPRPSPGAPCGRAHAACCQERRTSLCFSAH